jgi:hypothetical protein
MWLLYQQIYYRIHLLHCNINNIGKVDIISGRSLDVKRVCFVVL